MSDIIREAYLLFNKKKYSQVISLLEPQVFRFRENFNFFYMLGMSCLYQGDYGGSFSYLRRASDINENNVDTILGIAVIYLKRGDTGSALRLWLEVLEIDPANAYAQRGLNYLKKKGDADSFTDLSAQDKLLKFLPQTKKKKKFPLLLVLLLAAVLLVLSVIVFIYPGKSDILNRLPVFSSNNSRDLPEVEIDARKDFIDIHNDFSITLTEKEVENLLKEIQDNLYDYRDNLAMYKINIINSSNASEYIKDRANLLSKYVKAPELTEFKDNFAYSDVEASPLLYNNCYILWKGKTVNLEETTNKISFDLLVGYHEEIILEGSVPVIFNFPIRILQNQPIELLGKIIADPDSGQFSIEGISIRRL